MKSAFLFAALLTAVLGVPDPDDSSITEAAAIPGTDPDTAPTSARRPHHNLVQDLVQTPTSITGFLDEFSNENDQILTKSKSAVTTYVTDIAAAFATQTTDTNTASQKLQKAISDANKADKTQLRQLSSQQTGHIDKILQQVAKIEGSAQNDLKTITDAIRKIKGHAGNPPISLVSANDDAAVIDISGQARTLHQGMSDIMTELNNYTTKIGQAHTAYVEHISRINSQVEKVESKTTQTEEKNLKVMQAAQAERLKKIIAAVDLIRTTSSKAKGVMDAAAATIHTIVGGNIASNLQHRKQPKLTEVKLTEVKLKKELNAEKVLTNKAVATHQDPSKLEEKEVVTLKKIENVLVDEDDEIKEKNGKTDPKLDTQIVTIQGQIAKLQAQLLKLQALKLQAQKATHKVASEALYSEKNDANGNTYRALNQQIDTIKERIRVLDASLADSLLKLQVSHKTASDAM